MSLAGQDREEAPSGAASQGPRLLEWQRRHLGVFIVVLAGAVVSLDQWSKDWAQAHLSSYEPRHVVGPVNLVLEFNKGAAFSLGTGVYPVVVAVAVVLVAGVLVFSGRAVRGGVNLPVATGLGLLAGGAVSNLADRFLRHHHGAVVDFIQAVSWWPTFNVADAAITVGAVLLGAAALLSGQPGRRRAPGDRTGGAGLSPGGLRITVPTALDGERTDRALALLAGLSRSQVSRLLKGWPCSRRRRQLGTGGRRLRAGELLEVDLLEGEPVAAAGAQPAMAGLTESVHQAACRSWVVFADDDLVVVDKPAGLVVHPGAGNTRGRWCSSSVRLSQTSRPPAPRERGRASCTALTRAPQGCWSWPGRRLRGRPWWPNWRHEPWTGATSPSSMASCRAMTV